MGNESSVAVAYPWDVKSEQALQRNGTQLAVRTLTHNVLFEDTLLEHIAKMPILVHEVTRFMVREGIGSKDPQTSSTAAIFFRKCLSLPEFGLAFDDPDANGLEGILQAIARFEAVDIEKKNDVGFCNHFVVAALEAVSELLQTLDYLLTTDCVNQPTGVSVSPEPGSQSSNLEFGSSSLHWDRAEHFVRLKGVEAMYSILLSRRKDPFIHAVSRGNEEYKQWENDHLVTVYPYLNSALHILKESTAYSESACIAVVNCLAPRTMYRTYRQELFNMLDAYKVCPLRATLLDSAMRILVNVTVRPSSSTIESIVCVLRRENGIWVAFHLLTWRPMWTIDGPLRSLVCQFLTGMSRSERCRLVLRELAFFRDGALQELLTGRTETGPFNKAFHDLQQSIGTLLEVLDVDAWDTSPFRIAAGVTERRLESTLPRGAEWNWSADRVFLPYCIPGQGGYRNVGTLEYQPNSDQIFPPTEFPPTEFHAISMMFLASSPHTTILMGRVDGCIIGYHKNHLMRPAFYAGCHTGINRADCCSVYAMSPLSASPDVFISSCRRPGSMPSSFLWRYNGSSCCEKIASFSNVTSLIASNWTEYLGVCRVAERLQDHRPNTKTDDAHTLDFSTGTKILKLSCPALPDSTLDALPPLNDRDIGPYLDFGEPIPTFHPSDRMINYSGLLFDSRNGKLIHKFDMINRYCHQSGIFNPDGTLLIIDSEVMSSVTMLNARTYERMDAVNVELYYGLLAIDPFDNDIAFGQSDHERLPGIPGSIAHEFFTRVVEQRWNFENLLPKTAVLAFRAVLLHIQEDTQRLDRAEDLSIPDKQELKDAKNAFHGLLITNRYFFLSGHKAGELFLNGQGCIQDLWSRLLNEPPETGTIFKCRKWTHIGRPCK
ncbi:hypothetical protein BV898_10152 [Hypsibius exemplaris]|uniref:Uncharacterized protein n=1 Tax=Hypsibius exemplaris TaxID=2072580 RepID=A0A1W0WKF5_HYPEX|nr:hypothetical protein BV898_10152 [Hypsibius exemplaris]